MQVKPNAKIENLTTTQPLYTCMQFLGFVPKYNLEKQKLIKKIYFKTMSFCMISLIICSYAFNIYIIISTDDDMKILEILPWIMRLTMVHAINFTSIVNHAIFNKRNWNVLLKNIYETEFNGMNLKFSRRRIFFSYFMLSLVIIHGVSMHCRKKFGMNLIYFTENIHDIFLQGTMILIANIALLIKSRLLFLKNEISKLLPRNHNIEAPNKKIISLVNLFYKLINLMETYNTIFGACILMYSGNLLTGLLNSCNMFIDKKNSLLSFVDILIITILNMVCYLHFRIVL